ncbi:hypothetical protein TTHERM_00047350 (macronuclear) [Tetrahymena thermophila SB210]|uniref:Uncharacterized protein n=1 Tax=Tetrahymena thermophila (strain SB210) TaxID=312017 RepID=Q23DF6_TETTS|nr:hypothetical protein TTHERM_00047350 [Tetrahymena thermophila SB210]EAR94447.1 hypothetical protein TTHERM_00047350 [Tetrahymena thermophila SB210]|eukprot:XP_001014730.1 hypothetical protein TTHERM_00047350 [Tetrahymena thermophila SB210]
MSDDFIFIEEEQQQYYQNNPFYMIALQVESSRVKMFEVVEIPHLCLEMHSCFFSQDMQCIKKAHQYMKQGISSSYYNEIKKTLQKQLGILIKQQQIFTETFKQYKEDINFQNDQFSQNIVNSLTHYFSNPTHQKYSNESPSLKIQLISDMNLSNESDTASNDSNSQDQKSPSASIKIK